MTAVRKGVDVCRRHWRMIGAWLAGSLIALRVTIMIARAMLGGEAVIEALDLIGLHGPALWLEHLIDTIVDSGLRLGHAILGTTTVS